MFPTHILNFKFNIRHTIANQYVQPLLEISTKTKNITCKIPADAEIEKLYIFSPNSEQLYMTHQTEDDNLFSHIKS